MQRTGISYSGSRIGNGFEIVKHYDHDRQVWIADSSVNGVIIRGQEFSTTPDLHAFEDMIIRNANEVSR